jgi:dienelactone hydrolase
VRIFIVAFIATLGVFVNAMAKLHSETVDYKQGDTALQGYLVYDDAISGKRPGVLVVHEWWGLNDYPKHRADMLAQLGYVAFACDIYGGGKHTTSMDSARSWATAMYQNQDLLRQRVMAGLDELKKSPMCDPTKIAAIGYCFGGHTALELARAGAPILGVVSFHGTLATNNPDDAKNIKGKILVCTGADDPNVKPEAVTAFEDEMRKAGVDYQVVAYGGAVHAFTNPAAGNDNSKGMAYNEKADQRSWQAMKDFFTEVFK